MPIINYKILLFTFNHKDQIDELYLTFPNSLDIKKAFDSRCEDQQTKYNALIDFLQQVTSGDSGAKAIGVSTIAGLTATEVQTALEQIKLIADNAVLGGIPDGSITNIKLAPSTITYEKIASQGIKQVNIENYAINRNKIADGEVTRIKLQTFTGAGTGIDSTKLADGAVTELKMATDSVNQSAIKSASVGTDELIDFNIILSKLAPGSVDNSKLVDNTIETSKYKDGSITSEKLSSTAIDLKNINRERANSNGYLDGINQALISNTFYDFFDATNDYSIGKLDNYYARNPIVAIVNGTNTATVDTVVGIAIGQELTVQNSTYKESLVVQNIVGNVITFSTAFMNNYGTNAMIYRSHYVQGYNMQSLSFPQQELIGTGFGTKSANPATLPTQRVLDLAISPNGKFIVVPQETTSPYYRVYNLDDTNGTIGAIVTIGQTVVLPGSCLTVDISPNGKYIVFGYNVSPFFTIYNFDQTTGIVGVAENNGEQIPLAYISKARFSPDGNNLILSANTATRTVYTYSFNHESGQLYSSSINNTVSIGKFGSTSSPSIFAQCGIMTSDNNYILHGFGSPTVGQSSYFATWKHEPTCNIEQGIIRNAYVAPGATVTSIALNSNESYMCISYVASPYMRIYPFNIITGECSTPVTNPVTLPTGNGRWVTWSKENETITISHDNAPYITSYLWNNTTGFGSKLSDPPTTLGSNCFVNKLSPSNKTIVCGTQNTPFIHAYKFFANSNLDLLTTDLRYNITPPNAIKTIRVFVLYEKDAGLTVNASASISTTVTENYQSMTKVIVNVDSTHEEAQFIYQVVTAGSYVSFKVTPTRLSAAIDKKLIKILGYVEG